MIKITNLGSKFYFGLISWHVITRRKTLTFCGIMALLLLRRLKILPMHLRLDQMGYKAFRKFEINLFLCLLSNLVRKLNINSFFILIYNPVANFGTHPLASICPSWFIIFGQQKSCAPIRILFMPTSHRGWSTAKIMCKIL